MNLLTVTLAILLTSVSSIIADADSIAVGHHVVWSYAGPTMPQALISATLSGKVGGVIFYSENIDHTPDLPAQIASLQSTYRSSPSYPGYPLLLVVDQEGGLVNRLPPSSGSSSPPQSAKSIGLSPKPLLSAQTSASTIADSLSQYGITANLAPVLDVHRTSNDFTDREQRSFSSSPARVAEIASTWIATLQERGYPATAKHFPGLGAASAEENTDLRPVTIDISADELRSVDMLPYVSAINGGVKMVMASWAVYPALDDTDGGVPAGLSRRIVQGELRERLGFAGVTITDALEAGSLKAFGDTGELAVRAVQAGMDIVLASARQVAQGEQAHAAIVEALRTGRIERGEFEAATARIAELRRSLLQKQRRWAI